MKPFYQVEASFTEVGQSIAAGTFVRFLTSDMVSKNDASQLASGYPSTDYSMACLASFFDAMSGVKS